MAAENNGKDVLIRIDLLGVGGTGASWTTITQQRKGGLDRGSKATDSTHKGSNGWEKSFITGTNWGIKCGGLLDPSDPALVFLEAKWAARQKIYVQRDASAIGGTKKEGKSVINSYSESFDVDNLVEFELDLKGDDALTTSP